MAAAPPPAANTGAPCRPRAARGAMRCQRQPARCFEGSPPAAGPAGSVHRLWDGGTGSAPLVPAVVLVAAEVRGAAESCFGCWLMDNRILEISKPTLRIFYCVCHTRASTRLQILWVVVYTYKLVKVQADSFHIGPGISYERYCVRGPYRIPSHSSCPT